MKPIHLGKPLRVVSTGEKQLIINNYYNPHHQNLEKAVSDVFHAGKVGRLCKTQQLRLKNILIRLTPVAYLSNICVPFLEREAVLCLI